MSIRLRSTASVMIGLGVSIALAPMAFADPPNIPEPGSESAAATIGDLDNLGYDVNLQYENGVPNAGLSQCTVTDINTVGSAGSQKVAYVTINCSK
ncbi:hypothetical protein MANY_19400 [Mycolicibacterium anyangense]|uniref:PASTA domain-containing protein n=1 Tax=Mycolicibacterium anyangense TaxID=1431246 RepID=A0A6N4W8E7_9MYCO|nr:hypothetical protein [Mycolicibacterium anyangense]BBZ76603.1 hypothetical protein MANY_19400 [Mycolicibacterium anyangense]